MALPRLPSNQGFLETTYDLGGDPNDDERIGKILNDACHVFRHHAGGTWATHDKDRYAALLVEEIRKRPGLVGRLLATDDRAVKMITYRACELLRASDANAASQRRGTDD
jgi:hypothetical protein